jgi:hypothetical protein
MTEDERHPRAVATDVRQGRRQRDGAGLIADDAVFMAVGQEPFGKEVLRHLAGAEGPAVEGTSDIRELNVLRRLGVSAQLPDRDGDAARRADGPAAPADLTILRKTAPANGRSRATPT